ncbi:MAG: sigma-70 family RNA polymerase sigma factor [Hyphomicrobiaceae bacterium]
MLQTSQDLADLLVRVGRDRDRQAFRIVYTATSAKLFGIVVRILQRRDIAEEVLQDVYVKIWEKAAGFDPSRASPITWMATVARNRAIDEVRRIRPASLEETPEALEVPDTDDLPLDRLTQNEEARRLRDCLDKLDPDRRQMVLLAYDQGLSRAELAQRFGRPVATIKTWLHRSLAQLRKCLEQ